MARGHDVVRLDPIVPSDLETLSEARGRVITLLNAPQIVQRCSRLICLTSADISIFASIALDTLILTHVHGTRELPTRLHPCSKSESAGGGIVRHRANLQTGVPMQSRTHPWIPPLIENKKLVLATPP